MVAIRANRLRAVREAQGVSQLELAARSRVSPSAISNIETGKIFAYPGWRRRLAEALQVEEGEIFPVE